MDTILEPFERRTPLWGCSGACCAVCLSGVRPGRKRLVCPGPAHARTSLLTPSCPHSSPAWRAFPLAMDSSSMPPCFVSLGRLFREGFFPGHPVGRLVAVESILSCWWCLSRSCLWCAGAASKSRVPVQGGDQAATEQQQRREMRIAGGEDETDELERENKEKQTRKEGCERNLGPGRGRSSRYSCTPRARLS